MDNEIISYLEMCQREEAQLQRGMNFHLREMYSVILMSRRRNAPYRDRLKDDGETLIYEGHDVFKTAEYPEPKRIDQPEKTDSGGLTQNGLFSHAALAHKNKGADPERVRVYEKIHKGIWSYNGLFHLVDAWTERDENRQVFKFKLIAVEGDDDLTKPVPRKLNHRRVIPSDVKQIVYDRDEGKCVMCGARDELHFDHDLPYSKGGTSLTPENVQLLCARHNLGKSNKIMSIVLF